MNWTKKRKRRFCADFSSSSELVEQFLKSQPKNASLNLVELWRHWGMVLGPNLEGLAFPLGHKDNVLLIGAEDNLVLQELSFMSTEILERVNAFLEQPFFVQIQLSLLQGRATLDNVVANQSAEAAQQAMSAAYLPTRIPVSAPAKGVLGELELDASTALGRCYQKYIERFGKQQG